MQRAVDRHETESLVDTKLISKPKEFEGAHVKWSDWSFVLRAYAGAVGPELQGRVVDALGNPLSE